MKDLKSSDTQQSFISLTNHSSSWTLMDKPILRQMAAVLLICFCSVCHTDLPNDDVNDDGAQNIIHHMIHTFYCV